MEFVVHAHTLLARRALRRGDQDRAATNVAASLALIGLAWKGKQDDTLRLHLAQTRLLQGEIARRMGQAAEAQSAWNEARELLAADTQSAVPFDRLDPLVRALRLLGRGAEAAPYLQRLTTAGYVPLQRWPDAAGTLADTAHAPPANRANTRR
jgi:hypothetical protein